MKNTADTKANLTVKRHMHEGLKHFFFNCLTKRCMIMELFACDMYLDLQWKTPQAKQMCHILDKATKKSQSWFNSIQSEVKYLLFGVRKGQVQASDAECPRADWTFTNPLQQKWP